MTPAQIIALIRDVAVVAALAFLVWRIYHDGENAVKVSDMEAVQKQLASNEQTTARWGQEIRNADSQRKIDLDDLRARITAHSEPILVQPAAAAPRACAVPADPAASVGAGSKSAGDGPGRGIDLRPAVDAFKLKYEQSLIDCRAALDQWPR